MTLDNKSIGMRIREERERLNLPRDDFAEIINLSEYYVGQLERGERQMSLPTLVKIAEHLHLSLDYLVLGKTASGHSYVHDNHIIYETGKTDPIKDLHYLINKCSAREIVLIRKLVQTILPYMTETDQNRP